MEPIALDDTITSRSTLVQQLKAKGLLRSHAVAESFLAVPRHLFVPETPVETAYSDAPVITKWQDGHAISSSSQPSIMAMMLEMLQLQPGQRVLEIGAGTGYNAALIAHIVGETGQVVTIDVDQDIVAAAQDHLKSAGVTNVQVICRDGAAGWPEAAPYDRIVLTVGSSAIAPSWIEQLRPAGRLLLPLQLALHRFGPNQALTQQLKQQINAWVHAGRPFTWSPQGTMERLCIKAYPIEAPYQAHVHETMITRGMNLVFVLT